jgi:hypothetical protein
MHYHATHYICLMIVFSLQHFCCFWSLSLQSKATFCLLLSQDKLDSDFSNDDFQQIILTLTARAIEASNRGLLDPQHAFTVSQ